VAIPVAGTQGSGSGSASRGEQGGVGGAAQPDEDDESDETSDEQGVDEGEVVDQGEETGGGVGGSGEGNVNGSAGSGMDVGQAHINGADLVPHPEGTQAEVEPAYVDGDTSERREAEGVSTGDHGVADNASEGKASAEESV